MSSGPENRFIKSIHDKLPKSLHREKMHNPYRGGTFDVWYSGNHTDMWIEYKYGDNKLSPLQLKWGTDRYNEGRNVFVIVGDKDGATLYIAPEDWVNFTNGYRYSKDELAKWIYCYTMGTNNGFKPDKKSKRTIKRNGVGI